MSTVSERIESTLKKNGVATREVKRTLSDLCGISYQAVSQWFNGATKNIESGHLAKIANKYGIDLNWLITGEGESEPRDLHQLPKNTEYYPVIAWETPDDLPADQYVIVPRVDVEFCAGNGLVNYVTETKSQGMAFMWGWIQLRKLNPNKLISVRVTGNSMSPTIPDGSIVTLDTSKTELEGTRKVWAIRYGDELRIKRLSKRFDGAWVLESDNPEYEKEIIQGDDLNHIQIIGRYVAHSFDGEL